MFVADTFPDDVSVHGSEEQFLKKVITDNAIGFSDDRQNRHWVGYYLENAKIRLSQVATVHSLGFAAQPQYLADFV